MGTTLTDLNARDGFGFQWVLFIEGYEYLLTDGDAAAALAAWSSWTGQALSGLSVLGDFDQSINPFDAFSSKRSLQFQVMDCTGDDTFGIDVARTAYGAKCYLTADLEADGTTINVTDNSDFPSSGHVFIGHEKIAYSAKPTGTTLTISARAVHNVLNEGVGRAHAIPSFTAQVQVAPAVTLYPQTWIGRWVALYMHRRLGPGATLDTSAQAHLVFAGRIADISDAANGVTSVSCTDVLEELEQSVMLKDQWEAEVADGFQVTSRDQIRLYVFEEAAGLYDTGWRALTTGWRTLEDVLKEINQAGVAIRTLRSTCSFGVRMASTDAGPRVMFTYNDTAAGNKDIVISLAVPERVAKVIGVYKPEIAKTGTLPDGSSINYVFVSFTFKTGSGAKVALGYNEPLRTAMFQGYDIVGVSDTFAYTDNLKFVAEKGTFFDNASFIPSGMTPPPSTTNWGIFEFAGQRFMAQKATEYLNKVTRLQIAGTLDQQNADNLLETGMIKYSAKREPMLIRQVAVLDGSLIEVIMALATSTGATSNNGTYDTLPWQLGAGIPETLVSELARSLARIEGSTLSGSIVLAIDRPTTFRELLNADLILRRAFLTWFQGSIRAVTWASPRAQTAIAALTEENKAGDGNDPMRTVTERTDRFLRNMIKIEYNRTLGTEKFESQFNIVDVASVQNTGSERAVTIKARNSFAEYAATGDSVKNLVPAMVAILPFVSRPRFQIRRTVDQTFFEKLYPGAIVTIDDNFARNPLYGTRGMSEIPAMITRLRYDFGGFEFGSDSARRQFGEIDAVLLEYDADTTGDAGYSALVDKDANTGGFTSGWDSGNQTLRTVANRYTASGAANDASFFSVGDIISIFEVGQASGGLSWDGVEIISINGTDIKIDNTLTGYTSGKYYKIVSDTYNQATTEQRSNQSYLANESDRLIQSARIPFVYCDDDPDGSSYSNQSGSPAIVIGDKIDNISDDGAPSCVAGADEIMCAIDHLIDFCTNPRVATLMHTVTEREVFVVPWHVGTWNTTGNKRAYLRVRIIVEVDKTAGQNAQDVEIAVSVAPPIDSEGVATFSTTSPPRFYQPCRTVTMEYDGANGSPTVVHEMEFDDIQINRLLGNAQDGSLYVTIYNNRAVDDDHYFKFYGFSECRLIERST